MVTFDDILDAAEGIYQERSRPEDITFPSLFRYMGCKPSGYFNHLVKEHYMSEVEEINQEYDVKISPIALLRAEAGGDNIEDHPIIKARKVYPGFTASQRDWRTFPTIPLEIDVKEAELLGIIWSDARKNDRKRGTYEGIELFLIGRCNDFEFYEQVVGPRVKEVFNLSGEVKKHKNKSTIDYTRKGKKYNFTGTSTEPCVRIGSTAIATWLCEDMGFPDLEAVLELLPLTRQKLAFMEGYLAGKGTPTKCAKYTKMDVHNNDEHVINVIKTTLEALGVKSKSYTQVQRIDSGKNLPKENVRHLIRMCRGQIDNLKLLNPRHEKVLYG